MKESDREDLANSSGLEPYAGDGNIVGVASAFAKATARQVGERRRRSVLSEVEGPAIELRTEQSDISQSSIPFADLVMTRGRQHRGYHMAR